MFQTRPRFPWAAIRNAAVRAVVASRGRGVGAAGSGLNPSAAAAPVVPAYFNPGGGARCGLSVPRAPQAKHA